MSVLPLLPILYSVVYFSLALLKGCVLHRLMLDHPDPAHVRRVALAGLVLSSGVAMLIEGFGLYTSFGMSSPPEVSDAEWRAAAWRQLPYRITNFLFGFRTTFHLCAFSYVCVRESARVLVHAVARLEADILCVLDAENGHAPASLYEELHEIEIRLRVQFQLSPRGASNQPCSRTPIQRL